MTTQAEALQQAKEALIKGYKDGIYTPKQFSEALDAFVSLATVSDAQPVGRFADNAAPEGQELSIDVSTGEDDARHRVYARLTGEVMPTGDGAVWLAEKTGQNFPAPDVRPCAFCGGTSSHDMAFPHPRVPIQPSVPVSKQKARFAIDGAIEYGRKGTNKPPTDDHWLMEYWNIGRDLAKAAYVLPSMPVSDEQMMDAAWSAYQNTPIDMVGDSDAETRKCVENAVRAALLCQPAPVQGVSETLKLVLPMAKAYAASNPVGTNATYIEQAEQALASQPAAPVQEPVAAQPQIRKPTGDELRAIVKSLRGSSDGPSLTEVAYAGWMAALSAQPVQDKPQEAGQARELVDRLRDNAEIGRYDGSDYMLAASLIEQLISAQAAPAVPDAAELEFNAKRLRRVVNLVGLGAAVPESDADLLGCMGSVLGLVAGRLEAPVGDGHDYQRQNPTAYVHESVVRKILGSRDDLQAAFLERQAAAPAVPQGRLIGREPTDAMQAAGAQAIRFDTTVLNKMWTANAVFRAMWDAALSAPAEQEKKQ